MKALRPIFIFLSLALAGTSSFALEPVPWNHKDYAAEFKYFQEGAAFTPETWATLAPKGQEIGLLEARQPALERQQAMKNYYAAAMKKWDTPSLRDYTSKTKETDIKAVDLWLGKAKGAAFAKKLAVTSSMLKKARRDGLSKEESLALEPYLQPEAIEELLAVKAAAEALKKQASPKALKGPDSKSTASLNKFAGPDPSKLGADSFAKLYDNMNASGADPVVAGRGQYAAGAAQTGAAVQYTSPQKKAAFEMPEVKSAPAAGTVPAGNAKSTALTSDAYGITVYTNGSQQPLTFRKGEEAVAAIRKLPDGSITKIVLYGHGGPGLQTVGSFDVDADEAGRMLKGKMARGGLVQFTGCNTSSIGGATLNPLVGLSMVTRRLLYFSIPYFQDRVSGTPAEQAKQQWEKGWNADLARDTSLNLRGAVVCGYRTFGLVPGRLPGVTALMGNQEATTPGYVAGKKACYQDGKEVPAP
ncbi:MAG: hypothetical protein PHV36_14715 [Elusimicrobiales bacterium]|nr:hypothetical protein [Elusimicrobiales bacterium]